MLSTTYYYMLTVEDYFSSIRTNCMQCFRLWYVSEYQYLHSKPFSYDIFDHMVFVVFIYVVCERQNRYGSKLLSVMTRC